MPDTHTHPPDRYVISDRTRVRRHHERGSHGRAEVHAILDALPLCHVGYLIDGAPYVTPTLQWRDGDRVYWHGSSASRFLRQVEGTPVCLTVSAMDGYVLARSAFSHSVNYRSAMVFGIAHAIEDEGEKADALRGFVDGLFPGRWETLRPITTQELKATAVLWMEIDEASAKVRAAPPADADEAAFPVWAGVVPVRSTLQAAEPAPDLPPGLSLPGAIADLIASGRLR
ncbi:MAG: pyridoxamine 5'-phosphate oxidase family protein [Acetobacteraceae bacterium]|nr:pyridoxamine 5'-phosphate oxidase family protein [Acetobacteraceae bacterium]